MGGVGLFPLAFPAASPPRLGDLLLRCELLVLRTFQCQVGHQAFLTEDEADYRVLDGLGVEGRARTD